MSYKSKSREIRDAVVALLSGVQLNDEDAFELVTTDPSSPAKQEPTLFVLPGEIASSKGAVGQQDRTINFVLWVILNLEDESRTQAQTYDYMYDLAELAMTTLEQADFDDSLNTSDTPLGTWILETSRGTMIPADSDSGAILLCTIDVAVSYSIDLQ